MSTQASTAELILSQIHSAGESKVLKMFGEYGLYLDGKIIAQGKHHKLLENCPLYARLYQMQFADSPAEALFT